MEQGLPTPVARKLGPVERFGLRTTLLAVAFLVVAIPFGLLLEQVTTGGPATRYDASLAQGLNDRLHGRGVVIGVLHVISFTGKPIFLFLAVGSVCVWLLRHRAWKLITFLVVTCAGGGIVDTIVKLAVARHRPIVKNPIIHAFGNSFPSGHSMQAVVCFGAILLVLAPLLVGWKRTAAVTTYVVWCLAIGLSRIALGVHFITDVVGGYLLGAGWLAGMVAVFEIWREERGRRKTAVVTEGVEPEEAEELVTA